MNKAWFEFNGINSTDMYLRILNDMSFPSPEMDIELVEVMGKDGDLIIDNKRLKGANVSFPVHLRLPDGIDVNEAATQISSWLKGEPGWHKLKFSGSPRYEYIAICYEQFNILEVLKRYGKVVINFKIKPYKRLIQNGPPSIANGSILFNPEKRIAKPLIKIYGSGDITLKNNGNDWLLLKGVDGRITIDSELMSAYKDNLPQYDKVIELDPMFPLLNPGENKLTWTGSVTNIEILPRWEAIV